MPNKSRWPLVEGRFKVGNPKSVVAICTLSSLDLINKIPLDNVALIGKSVTENLGVEKIVKNLVANPCIRFLIICGKDSKGHFPGQAIISLVKNGVDNEKRIIGAKGAIPVLKNLTSEEIERFRRQIEPIDLTNVTDIKKISTTINDCLKKNPKAYKGKKIMVKEIKPIRAYWNAKKEEKLDKKGFFTIQVDSKNKKIVVEHYSSDWKLQHKIIGNTPQEIYYTIIRLDLISSHEHAAYLGKELTKAYLALKNNLVYEQEKDLEMKGILEEIETEIYQPLIVKATTLGEAWEKAVRLMMQKGYDRFVKAPEYQTWSKDSPMFIHVKNPLKEPRISKKAPITLKVAEEYAKNLINGMPKEKENQFDYTYYSRLRCYPDCLIRAGIPNITDEQETKDFVNKISKGKCIIQKIDQVDKAIKIFKKDPTRRTVVMHTWIPLRDLAKFTPQRKDTSSPCLVLIHPQITENKLHFNIVMKTNDLYSAWSSNAFAFTALQKYMADKLNIEVGHYTHFSVAMQIYEEVYDAAKMI